MNNGYIKLHRSLLDNPICRKPEYGWLWCILLMRANHKDRAEIFNGKKIKIEAGQTIVGRKALSRQSGISESKVYRILKYLENEHQIKQQPNNKYTTITILNWHKFQSSKQQSEQPVNNQRTTSEQPVNTNKNDKKEKNDKNDKNNIYIAVINHLNQKTNSNYKATTKKTQDLIKARLNEGFTVDDFKTVINTKTAKWKTDPKMSDFLRPETLFGNKFESYLNEKIQDSKEKKIHYVN